MVIACVKKQGQPPTYLHVSLAQKVRFRQNTEGDQKKEIVYILLVREDPWKFETYCIRTTMTARTFGLI
jgi:hypothetical protein